MIDIMSYLWSFTVAFQICSFVSEKKHKECQGAVPLEAIELSGLFGSS